MLLKNNRHMLYITFSNIVATSVASQVLQAGLSLFPQFSVRFIPFSHGFQNFTSMRPQIYLNATSIPPRRTSAISYSIRCFPAKLHAGTIGCHRHFEFMGLTCAEALHFTRFMLVEANPHAYCLILNLYYHFNGSCIIWQETLKWCCMETTQVPL